MDMNRFACICHTRITSSRLSERVLVSHLSLPIDDERKRHENDGLSRRKMASLTVLPSLLGSQYVASPRSLNAMSKFGMKPQQTRSYHSTSQNPIVFLGAAVLLGGVGYIAYRKYRGEPVMPSDALKAQEAYRKLEANRQGQRRPSKRDESSFTSNNKDKK
jgi:hypothetical protein